LYYTLFACTVYSASYITLWTYYRFYFKSISPNIELQVYSVTWCWPFMPLFWMKSLLWRRIQNSLGILTYADDNLELLPPHLHKHTDTNKYTHIQLPYTHILSDNILTINFIISSPSAHYNTLLDMGLSNCSPPRSIFGYSHPASACRPA
jgi:hypothetical protein